MSGLSDLLVNLLNYVVEQSKVTDPNGFKLTGHKEFIRYQPSLAGLPGVDFDKSVEGDHIWLRVARLEARSAPAISDANLKGLIAIDVAPNGQLPRIDEVVLKHRLATGSAGQTPEELSADESRARATLHRALTEYTPLWTAWAEGEKPRRKTIGLYGDLFPIKHQLELEETAKPHELVWGIWVTA